MDDYDEETDEFAGYSGSQANKYAQMAKNPSSPSNQYGIQPKP